MKASGKYLFYSFILLITGFFLSFSYQLAKTEKTSNRISEEWKKEDSLRSQILDVQKTNKQLTNELKVIQQKVQDKEENVANEEKNSAGLVKELKQLRMIVGGVKVKGEGIEVTLSDSSYIPDGENPNNYIVHEEHIREVINELLVSGAEAVAVNGQRINHNSYISCIGPVVSVDGNQYPAPFVISAIGNKDTLEKSLNLYIANVLASEGIDVSISKKDEIRMEPLLAEKENEIEG